MGRAQPRSTPKSGAAGASALCLRLPNVDRGHAGRLPPRDLTVTSTFVLTSSLPHPCLIPASSLPRPSLLVPSSLRHPLLLLPSSAAHPRTGCARKQTRRAFRCRWRQSSYPSCAGLAACPGGSLDSFVASTPHGLHLGSQSVLPARRILGRSVNHRTRTRSGVFLLVRSSPI